MGIQLNGTSGTDVISAVDGSLTVEGLTISGDFNIADKIVHSGDTNTAIRFPAADTFSIETAGSERLRIDSNGNSNFGLEKAVAFPSGTGIQVYHSANPRIKLSNDNTGFSGTDGTQIYLSSDADTIIDNKDSKDIIIHTNAAEKLRINSDGKVGIATGTGSGLINTRHAGTNQQVLHVRADLGSSNGRSINLYTPDTDNSTAPFRFQTGNGYLFQCDNEDVFTIAHDRTVGIGIDAPARKLHIKNSGIIKLENTSTGGWIGLDLLASSGTNNYDGYMGLQDSDGLFFIDNNSNGHDFAITQTGQLRFPQNGAEVCWGASQQFRISWDNGEERAYLTGVGAYGLAFRVNGGNRLEINKTTGDVVMQGASGRNFQWDNSAAELILSDNGSGASARLKIGSSGDLQMYHDVSGPNHITCSTNQDLKVSIKELQLYDYSGVSHKMTVDSNGDIKLGTAGSYRAGERILIQKSAGYNETVVAITQNNGTVTERRFLNFFNSAGNSAGGVRHTGATSCQYHTSSDYRLKENVVDIADGISRIKQLKPRRFNFKTEPGETVDGFLAHEVSPVIPDAVSGEKDGEVMQSLGYERLTPLLTAALKEAIAKIETLEAEVAALKSS